MRVTAPGGATAARPAAGARRAEGGRFVLPEAGGAPTAVGAAAGVQGLWTLQAVPDATGERRRRLVRRAAALLADLDALRLALIDGAVPPSVLERLRAAGDPGLDAAIGSELGELLQAIEVRAAVEIAKLEATTRPA